MYELNYAHAQYMKLSNDAFYALFYGEEMIDDSHQDEVDSILAQFPNGFEIEDDSWDELDGNDAGLIECTIIPYEESAYAYTHQVKFFNNWVILIAPNADWSKLHIKHFNTLTGDEYGEEDVEPFVNRYGNVQINYGQPNKSGMYSCFYQKHIKPR